MPVSPEPRRVVVRLAATAAGMWLIAAFAFAAYLWLYPSRPAHVHVRWASSVDRAAQSRLEQRYSLTRGALREGRTWGYVITDVSSGNLRALVQDPAVEDTHEINRQRFSIWRTARREPYRGPYAAWLPVALQIGAVLLLLVGTLPAALWIVESVGPLAPLRPLVAPATHAFVSPPSPRPHIGATARWLAARIPPASAEGVAAFRLVLGPALVALLLTHPIVPRWVTPWPTDNPLSALQRLGMSAFLAAPGALNWLRTWALVWGALFTIGLWARLSFVLLTAGMFAWAAIYTSRIGAHSISALLVTLIGLMWSRWGDAWSVDARRRHTAPAGSPSEYGYTVWLPGLVLGVTFFAAAVAKLRDNGLAWILNGTVKYHFLSDSRQAPVEWGLWVGRHDALAVAFSLAAVAVESLVIVGALSRTYRWRAAAGLAGLALLLGFVLLQGVFWPGWWILLLSFLPWHRVTGARAAVDADLRLSRLRLVQFATVVAIVVQQIFVSARRIELSPLLSTYDMYSKTYASPQEYEKNSGMTYWLAFTRADGTSARCQVSEANASIISGMRGGLNEQALGIIAGCPGGATGIRDVSVEGRQVAIDWTMWRPAGEKQVPLAGPIPLVPR